LLGLNTLGDRALALRNVFTHNLQACPVYNRTVQTQGKDKIAYSFADGGV